ncbi:MAG TPA: AraC family transcriptional regulator [Chthoniobacterales bacterium]|nr:AraC family transcriptional regulator [Chthoniobacterales bacterium]
MRISKKSVPLMSLKDFGSSPFLEHGIFVEAFEECVSVRHKRMEVHRHDYVELFLLHGQGSVLIDFENCSLSGKSLIAIGPGRVHAWQANKMTGLYIAFTQEFFDGAGSPPSTLFDYPFIFGDELSSVIHLEPKEGVQAQDLFRDIHREFEKHEKLAVEMIRHQLRLLMVHLSRLYAATSPAPFAAVSLVRRFRQAVERSFHASTSVRDYAQTLGVTTSHLNESLRLETGLTAGNLIRARLLLEAKRLLLHTELTMAEIGYELGFEDPSYFSRFIRRELKTNPAELRRLIRQKYQKFMR